MSRLGQCILAFVLSLGALVAAPGRGRAALDLGSEATVAGRSIFEGTCRTCHGMKYLGLSARMPGDVARRAFGREPPDLSLMAAARGRGDGGVEYVVRLLTSYEDTPAKNSVFPGIAMPPPIPTDDPELEAKAHQVAAFLYHASFPEEHTRRTVGTYTIAFTLALTALLYALYRSIRREVHG